MGRIVAIRSRRSPRAILRRAAGFSILAALIVAAVSSAAPRPELDVSAERRPSAQVLAQMARLRSEPALASLGMATHIDERYDVPSFFRATPAAPTRGTSAGPDRGAEQAARDHLVRLAPHYRLAPEDVRGAVLRDIHDTGVGGIIVTFEQRVDGIDVFRDQVKVLMDRHLELLAVSGHILGRGEAGRRAAPALRIGVTEAVVRALEDFSGASGGTPSIRPDGPAPGGYERFVAQGLPGGRDIQPIRAKRVLFRLADDLVPGWYVEVIAEDDATAYVVAARDGSLLYRHGLIAADSYSYRAWADATDRRAPMDGPQGNGMTPHPTGFPDFAAPSFLAPPLVSLQNGPISTNDPWLPPGATQTTGNNVDAYADLVAPDGFSAGDLRPNTTSPNTFDWVYDTNLPPMVNATQQMASATQLFYLNNWFHDWFYDAGFTETAGNAQAANYGRGGVEGDRINAEVQNYSMFGNANMLTPADGGSPRMQTSIWIPHPYPTFTVNVPATIAGPKPVGSTLTGLLSYSKTADLALPNPNAWSVQSSTSFACGLGPQWVTIADLDGDGDSDLATANYNTNDVSVLLGNGAGSFGPQTDYAMAEGPYTVETPDLNHDSLPDLVCANYSAGTFSVRLGTGGGAFGAKTDFAAGAGTAIATSGRFDADAHDDIVTANRSANTVSVFLGNGSGGFGAPVSFATGASPNWVAVGDVNHDGASDLVTANYSGGSISVLLGNGAGGFGAKTDFGVGGNPVTLALGDLNGDGNGDVVTANLGTNTLSVLLGDGAGGFGAPTDHAVPASPITVRLGDLDGDGRLDAVVCSSGSNSVSVLQGDGAGSLAAPISHGVGTSPFGVAIGHVNADAHPELVSANYGSSSVTVLSGLVTDSSQDCPGGSSLAGRIAWIDVPNACAFTAQVQAAASAGAVGAIVRSASANVTDLWDFLPIPTFMIGNADGNALRDALRRGRVNVTMVSQGGLLRDGGLENLVNAHEWGHYLSNRLIGNGNGLNNHQGSSMGEGWADFCALLMMVRPEDALVPSNPAFDGTYAVAGYAMSNSAAATDRVYYFGTRRYPYSTDLTKSPLTFHYIEPNVPMPVGPPLQGVADGSTNTFVHSSGEIWCSMLWECYAALLRDTGRLTFAQAQDRMRRYLVASLKLTPVSPTFVEAREAVLAVASASDGADYAAFCTAFAKRGLGFGAVAPPRFDLNNANPVESFSCDGVGLLAARLEPEYQGCDADSITDVGERGRVVVRFRNAGGTPLASALAGVTCSSPNVSFPYGAMQPVGPLASGQLDSVAVLYTVTTNAGIENATFTPLATGDNFDHAGVPVPVVFNRDMVAGLTGFDNLNGWTYSGWYPLAYGEPVTRVAVVPNNDFVVERILTSAVFVPATNTVSIRMSHWYWFDYTPGPVYYDGGVVELSSDNGATWTDIGSSAISNGYPGTLAATLNPLSGRPAFVGYVGTLDWTTTVLQPVGAYAGQPCRLRFRAGFDELLHGDASGWEIDELQLTLAPGSTYPFSQALAEADLCALVDVPPFETPAALSVTLRGANPVRGPATFVFELPRPSTARLEVFDLSGRRVATLADGFHPPGRHEVRWSAEVPAGVYFARFKALGETRGIRTVVIR